MFRHVGILRSIDYQQIPVKVVSSAALAAASIWAAPAAQAQPVSNNQDLIELGREIFFNETFGGNGRTCGTCHRAEDNFAISPAFIATLPQSDPLFVAENNPDLRDLENPRLLREFAVIVENTNGFDNPTTDFTLRGIPHTLGMSQSIDSAMGPALGWSGDGSPGDGSLRSFAIGAVIQHFPRTLNRVEGVDFRLPNDLELDALEAFQISLGRQEELDLPLPLKGVVAARGQEIFLDDSLGRCNICHFNAGANGNPDIFGPAGNRNFNTGVEDLVDQPLDLTGEFVPPDDGLGSPGDGSFNTPSLVEAADTGPFFHNNAIETIEGAVAFYNSDAFNDPRPPQAQIDLEPTQVVAVAAFLRVINALDNIRESDEELEIVLDTRPSQGEIKLRALRQAAAETDDATQVLQDGGLHPEAVLHLAEAKEFMEEAIRTSPNRTPLIEGAIAALERARRELVEDGTSLAAVAVR